MEVMGVCRPKHQIKGLLVTIFLHKKKGESLGAIFHKIWAMSTIFEEFSKFDDFTGIVWKILIKKRESLHVGVKL